MSLFILKIGKAKDKMEDVMIDKMSSVNVYLKSRSADFKKGKCDGGWFNISPAPKNSVAWRRKSATIGGNRSVRVPVIGRNGQDRIPGYINKNGFN